MIFFFNFLNNLKIFPYYIITPLPYAIGTAAWDILSGISKHTSDLIVEKNKWASISFKESLS